jgi:type II secretory pathway pseudopilin PulG
MEWIQLIIGIAIGAIASWLISYIYYRKSSQEAEKTANDLKDTIATLKRELNERNTIHKFENLIEESNWSCSTINGIETWVCDDDQTFQIQLGEPSHGFSESWTKMYPDPLSSEYPVILMIGGSKIKVLTFVSIDGGRIFIPRPDIQPDGEFFWDKNKLEFKVCSIIGNYYIYNNIEGVAKRSNVKVVS